MRSAWIVLLALGVCAASLARAQEGTQPPKEAQREAVPETFDQCIAAIKSKDLAQHAHASAVLAELVEGMHLALAEALEDPAHVRGAEAALGRMITEAVPPLARALSHDSKMVRQRAAKALEILGSRAEPAVPALAKALEDESETVRDRVAKTLELCGEKAAPALPALVKALEDKSKTVRRRVARALAHLGPKASVAGPALIKALSDSSGTVRQQAALALGQVGAGEPAVPPLVRALRDERPEVRSGAAQALGTLGLGGAATRTALEQASRTDPDPEVRRVAGVALKSVR